MKAAAVSRWGMNAFVLKSGTGQNTPVSTARRHKELQKENSIPGRLPGEVAYKQPLEDL